MFTRIGTIFVPPGSYRVTAMMGREGSATAVTLEIRLFKTDTVLATLTTTSPTATVGPTAVGEVVLTPLNSAIEFWLKCSNNTARAVVDGIGLTAV